jgi:phospholipase/carboxylesterase
LASPDSPVLVVLHGIGSNEQDLMGVAPYLDPRLHVVSYRAPRLYGPGYSWFDIEWNEGGLRFDEDQAADSLQILLTELREFEGRSLLVGGFSQGAAMTLGVLFALGRRLGGAMMLSGRMSQSFLERQRAPEIAGIPCLVQHGIYDNVIPVEHGRQIDTALRALGAEVEYREYPMGHEVSLESISDLGAWLTTRLG